MAELAPTPLESLSHQIKISDLWCIQNLLENGIITTEMLSKAIAHSSSSSWNWEIGRPLRDFLLEVFEWDLPLTRIILNGSNMYKVYSDPKEFAEKIFRYEHEGSVSLSLLIRLELDAFIEYVQMKGINIHVSMIYPCMWGNGRSEVMEWIASNVRLKSGKDIEYIYRLRAGIAIPVSGLNISTEVTDIFIERLFDELVHDSHTILALDSIINYIQSHNVRGRDRLRELIIRALTNGILITNRRLIDFSLQMNWLDDADIEAAMDPTVLANVRGLIKS